MICIATCEHYSNHVPAEFKWLFNQNALSSHRGYDIGASTLFDSIAPLFDHSFYYPYSRLLIEPNRSLHHRNLFSEFSTKLDKSQKDDLIRDYYQPYRNQIHNLIDAYPSELVVHIGIHTFTPRYNNQNRDTKIGILYDPSHLFEKEIAKDWKVLMKEETNEKVRFNYPYRGASDGFTTSLRKLFPDNYVGFELEIRNDSVEQLHNPIVKSINHLLSSSLASYSL